MTFITRFAPSPTGPLHLGHAYSAIISHDMARRKGGKFYVRIEDLDQSRSKKKWENQIFEDLDWLGLSWDGPIFRQSEELEKYKRGGVPLYLYWKKDSKKPKILPAILSKQIFNEYTR